MNKVEESRDKSLWKGTAKGSRERRGQRRGVMKRTSGGGLDQGREGQDHKEVFPIHPSRQRKKTLNPRTRK